MVLTFFEPLVGEPIFVSVVLRGELVERTVALGGRTIRVVPVMVLLQPATKPVA